MSSLRKVLAIATIWLPTLIIPLTWRAWRDRLPQDLPTHWGTAGPADDITNGATYFGWMCGIAVVIALVGTVLLLVPMRGRWAQRGCGGVAGAATATILAMWLASTAPALDVTDPYTVELGIWFLPLMAAPLYAVVPLFLIPPVGTPPVPVQAEEIAPMALTPTEKVAWSSTVTSPLFIAVTAVVFAVGIALFFPIIASGGLAAALWTLIPLLLAFILLAAFCAFRVTVDWRGFRVTSRLLGIPLKRIALENLTTAQAAILEPSAWGGWGYRFGPGRSAIIMHRGPGLVLTQKSGIQFAITLAHPEEPASILLGLIRTANTATV